MNKPITKYIAPFNTTILSTVLSMRINLSQKTSLFLTQLSCRFIGWSFVGRVQLRYHYYAYKCYLLRRKAQTGMCRATVGQCPALPADSDPVVQQWLSVRSGRPSSGVRSYAVIPVPVMNAVVFSSFCSQPKSSLSTGFSAQA